MSSSRPAQVNSATATSPSSASPSSGFFRQRNGSGIVASQSSSSGFFDRLRRPRTATNASLNATTREGGGAINGAGTDYGADEPSESNNSGSGFNSPSRNGTTPRDRNGLLRSNSSSQVNLPTSASPEHRRPGLVSHHSSQSHSGIRFGKSSISNGSMAGGAGVATSSSGQGNSLGFPLLSRSGSSQGVNTGANGSGGPPTSSGGFSRMFRRYSQGAGRGNAAASEARSAASGGGGADALNSASASIYDAAATAPDLITDSTTQSHESTSAQNSARNSNGDGPPNRSAEAATTTTTGSGVMANGSARATGSSAAIGLSTSSSVEPSSHRIRLVPHLEATRSLHFEPIERDLAENSVAVKIGRFTDRGQLSSVAGGSELLAGGGAASTVAGSAVQSTTSTVQPSSSGGIPGARGGAIPSSTGGAGRVDTGRIAFKSKVVSRGHAEIWCEGGGKVFLRDTKSSSGTFLNHIRLSAPNVESKPFQIKDGDVVQLGVDYQGGTEEIYRCVKMRVELNRGWQRGANQFNVNALRQLRALQGSPMQDQALSGGKAAQAAALPTNRQSLNVTDCCICLFSVTVCQALFIAPCSHVFHYKCIRPLLNLHHPGFSCPLCRTFADLEADVEEDEAWQQALLQEEEAASRRDTVDQAHLEASTPMNEEPLPSLHQAIALASSTSDLDHYVDAAAVHATTPSSTHGNDLTVHLGGTGDRNRSHESSPLSGSRRGSSNDEAMVTRASMSRRSESSHRDSPLRERSSRRPETAVSSSTVVPSAASATDSPASRRGTGRQRGSSAAGDASRDDAMDVDETSGGARSSLTDNGRRPSGPIDISQSTSSATSNAGPAIARHLVDGFGGSPGLSDARTPQNEHFLSTLAEAPLPPPSSARGVATRSPPI